MSNVTALQKAAPGFTLTPQSLDEAIRFADILSKSGLVPKDYQGNPGNILIAIQWGAEIGLQPLQAMQNIASINGRPSIWGDAMLALVRGSGLLEYIKEDPTDTGCTCIIKRKGEDEVVRTFSIEDAKRAGLAGKQGPWQQHPKRMMQMRARAFALRDVFPDVLRGVHMAEIAQDEPTEKNMGAAEEVPTASRPAPQSRAAKARAAIADRRAEQEEATLPPTNVPALDDVLAAIETAQDGEAMAAARALGAQLPDGPEKERASQAWLAKREILVANMAEQQHAEEVEA